MIPSLDEVERWTPKKQYKNESSWIMNLEENYCRNHESSRQKRQESWISRFKWFRFYPRLYGLWASRTGQTIACVAGVKRGREGKGEFGRARACGAHPYSLPLPFGTPATQASQTRNRSIIQLNIRKKCYCLYPHLLKAKPSTCLGKLKIIGFWSWKPSSGAKSCNLCPWTGWASLPAIMRFPPGNLLSHT